MSASALFGKSDIVGVTRGLAEFRAGRPIEIVSRTESIIALPVEGLTPTRLAAFQELLGPTLPSVVVTAQRAVTLGVSASTPVVLQLPPNNNAEAILEIASCARRGSFATAVRASDSDVAAVELAKLAHLLPTVLRTDVAKGLCDSGIVQVAAGAVGRFHEERAHSLSIAGEAEVPLASGIRARFVVFSDCVGESPVAVMIGAPDLALPTPVRVHSACLTGDVFGSRRCDCGDQLLSALSRLAALGGGIVLYLPQEGRGLGLANKMRAYRLQDAGLDTVDANMALGFDDDERQYAVGARMLEMLGCRRVILLTNNPAKCDGLANFGLDIVERLSLETPISADNRRYLTAKAVRSGHRLEGVIASLTHNTVGKCGFDPEPWSQKAGCLAKEPQ